MSIVDILGAEDNPFGLFLILILLLGATGYFDLPEKKSEAEGAAGTVTATPSTRPASPAILPAAIRASAPDTMPATMPVWRTRPNNVQSGRLSFRAAPRSGTCRAGARNAGAGENSALGKKRSFLSVFLSEAQDLLRKRIRVLPLRAYRSHPRHPLLRLRHNMLQ